MNDETTEVLDLTPLDTELALACLASGCTYTGVVATEDHGKAFLARLQRQVFDGFFDESMSEFYDPTAVAALAVAKAQAKKRGDGVETDDEEPPTKKPKTKAASKAAASKAKGKAKAKADVGSQLQALLNAAGGGGVGSQKRILTRRRMLMVMTTCVCPLDAHQILV